MTCRALLLVVLTWVCIPALPMSAQSDPTDPGAARGRVQLGPLGLTPSVALTNLGIDTNVFNEVDDPKSDFTFTVSPQVDASLRLRRARLRVMVSMRVSPQEPNPLAGSCATSSVLEPSGPLLTAHLPGSWREMRSPIERVCDNSACVV